MTHYPANLSPLVAAVALLAWGCGDLQMDPEEVGSGEYLFKHGPPPGGAPWSYYLTCYGGPSDSCYMGTPACGGKKVDGKWWYATGAYSFGCHAKLELRANGKCVVVEVVDNGPAGWVESKAAAKCGGTGYIIDASPLVTKHLFGLSCAGWSDCKKIQVRKVASSTPTGPGGCCKDACMGTKILRKDCSVGDCAAYGATCVNDNKGVRCVSAVCPAQGKKKVCVNSKVIGHCSDGAIATGDCSKYAAYCSTAGSKSGARCVSAFCVADAKTPPKAHPICLIDGRLAQCTAEGGLTNARACKAGERCVKKGGAGSCQPKQSTAPDAGGPKPKPNPADAQAPPAPDSSVPAPDLGIPPGPDPDLPPRAGDGGASWGQSNDAPITTLVGGCHLSGGLAERPPMTPLWPLVLLGLFICSRAPWRGTCPSR